MKNFRKEDKPLTFYDFITKYLAITPKTGILLAIGGLLSLIQVAPIKLNPWDAMLG